jgi:hypothetical protein
MMVEILDPSVQAEKRLRPFPPLKSKLLSLLTSCGTVRLFNQIVAARRGNHLLVIDVLRQHGYTVQLSRCNS